MRKKLIGGAAFLILILAWSPWITASYAEERATETFNRKWLNVIDGCGLECPVIVTSIGASCKAVTSNKIAFGRTVKLQFKCGMKNYFRYEKYYISPLGTAHFIPNSDIIE